MSALRCVNNRALIFHQIASVIFEPRGSQSNRLTRPRTRIRVSFFFRFSRPYAKRGRNGISGKLVALRDAARSSVMLHKTGPVEATEKSVTCVLSFNFSRETRFGDAPVMCRMRETDNGSVPAERFGPCMARRVRALLRLQNHAAGQVLLQGSEALLQERLLQVCVSACAPF